MKSSDIARIRLGSEAFTERWWERNKGGKIVSLDERLVGPALREWARACGPVSDMREERDTERAAVVCNALLAALGAAKSKCRRGLSDTRAAIERYESCVEDYKRELADHARELQAAADLEKGLVDARMRTMFFAVVIRGSDAHLLVERRSGELIRRRRELRSRLRATIDLGGTCTVVGGKKVVLVFDEKPPDITEKLKRTLRPFGYKPIVTIKGEPGIDGHGGLDGAERAELAQAEWEARP